MENVVDDRESEILYNKEKWIGTINSLMERNGWGIKDLSEKSGIPYDSIKKLMSGKINNPTCYTLFKISQSLGCSLDYLIDRDSIYGIAVPKLPNRAFSLIKEIANFEIYLQEQSHLSGTDFAPILIPCGEMYDGMIYNSISIESIDISAYDHSLRDIIMCGIKIIGDKLSPTYVDGDILLIAKDRFPVNNEIGIFLIGHNMYIRKYVMGDSITLKSFDYQTEPIIINDIDDIRFFGRIVTVIRK